MRYPVGTSTQDFNKNWYDAQPFGAKTSYGYHDGADYNTKTGADTDLGQPVYAVADGTIVYYHNASHPNSKFGRHMVLQCKTSRGTRWYHYAHCGDIVTSVKEVKEGDVLGHVGKSGAQWSHLHFAVLKVDPGTLPQGIDTIAKNTTEIKAWWEAFELLSNGGSMPDALQECLAQHTKLVDEAIEKNEQIKRLTDENKILADQLKQCQSNSQTEKIEASVERGGSKWELNGIQIVTKEGIANYRKV